MLKRAAFIVLFVALAAASGSPFKASAQPGSTAAPIQYRFSFPELAHRWMQVDATFADLDPGRPLDLVVSRASPGRYSLHDFAKNVYDVHAADTNGRELALTRPDPYGWQVPQHGASVVGLKRFGNPSTPAL